MKKSLLLFAIMLLTASLYSQSHAVGSTQTRTAPAQLDGATKDKLWKQVKKLTRELKKNEDKGRVYNSRAMAYFMLNEYESAIADYSEVIKLDPNCAECYIFRGFSKNLSKAEYEISGCADLKTNERVMLSEI
jgi:tetratricopeptide (TPR) repeat protein